MTNKYGYGLSSTDQNEDRQITTLSNCDTPKKNIYMDKQYGKDFNHPQYKMLIRKLKKGDLLYAGSIDRLGRNYEEIQKEWRVLTKKIGISLPKCAVTLTFRYNYDIFMYCQKVYFSTPLNF